MPKSAPATDFAETLVLGAVQVGTARAVLDTVATGRLTADSDHLIFVSVWIDPQADDETAVKDAARTAVTHALTEASKDPTPSKSLSSSLTEPPVLRRPLTAHWL